VSSIVEQAGRTAPGVEPASRRSRGRVRILAATDVAALAVAYGLTYVLADRIAPPAMTGRHSLLAAFWLAAAIVLLAAFAAYGLYERDDHRVTVSSFDEVGLLFHALLASSLVLLLAGQALVRFLAARVFSPLEAVIFLALALVLVPTLRGVVRTWALPRVMRVRRAVIVGSGSSARVLARKLAGHPEHGLVVVGHCDDGADDDLVRLGSRADIPAVVADHRVDWLILAEPADGPSEDLFELLEAVDGDVKISVVPQFADVFTSNATLDDVEGIPIVTLPRVRLSHSARVVKRAFDLVIGIPVALLLLPVLAACAIAIKLDGPGPVLFRQARRGRGGRIFRIVKFRTMIDDAERQREALAGANEVSGPLFKIRADPRVTRAGRFLRRRSLDELPQIWNVLRGEMSLVGPRPFVVHEADQMGGGIGRRRLDVTPGITGLWQVLGRNDIPYDEMLKLDYLYVTGWSAWWDFQILCKTVPAVLGGKGAS
jgi:exopolysaccharide biosynthesis polyprenyl glycosylphosphotransferase